MLGFFTHTHTAHYKEKKDKKTVKRENSSLLNYYPLSLLLPYYNNLTPIIYCYIRAIITFCEMSEKCFILYAINDKQK